MNAFEWAVCIMLGVLLGTVFGWAMALQSVLLDIRAELRRINQAYRDEIRKITGGHH